MIYTFLLLFIPVSLALNFWVHTGPLWIFGTGALSILPLAEWIRRATDQLANRAGRAIGGLLNITFGSVAELTLALFVLASGHVSIVKAQITGSIISTSLLGLGVAILIGGLKREKQTFLRERASLLGSLLTISVIALLIPVLFDYTEHRFFAARQKDLQVLNERLSICVAVVLILVYVANLIYTLITHRDVFASRKRDVESSESVWPVRRQLLFRFGDDYFSR